MPVIKKLAFGYSKDTQPFTGFSDQQPVLEDRDMPIGETMTEAEGVIAKVATKKGKKQFGSQKTVMED